MFQIEKTYHGWTFERVARHVLYWLAWLLFYSVVGSSYNIISPVKWAGLELLIMCVKLPFTYFLIYYLVPNYLVSKRYFNFFATLLISATIGGLLIWTLYYYVFTPYFFNHETGPFWTMKISFKALDLIYIASLPTVLKLHQLQSLREKQTLLLVEQKLGAELKLLKNQLHPHFLFNTLNNLYSMVLTQHPKAADVVVHLSDMMSFMLYECEGPLIDLEKEINNLKNYIELEKIRYGKRLEISLEIGGELQGKSIAPLLLIPFLENAFKHGVGKNEAASWVRVNLWVEDSTLTYLVENNLPEGQSEESLLHTQSGVGLSNIRKRLELLYPATHVLEIKKEDTFLAKLNLELSNEMSYH